VLGHAETLLAAMRHFDLPTKAVRLIFSPPRAKLHAVRRKYDRAQRIALIVKRREVETVSPQRQNAAVRRVCYSTFNSYVIEVAI
jgi:hypothetical protein